MPLSLSNRCSALQCCYPTNRLGFCRRIFCGGTVLVVCLFYTVHVTFAQAVWGDESISVGIAQDFTQSAIWGDMDGDGDLDVAVGNYSDVNQIYENRKGGFVLYWESPDSQATTSLAWGDMDRDGDLDLAVGNYGSPNQIFRNEQGQFLLAWETTGDSKGTSAVAWVDWNQDGFLDFATAWHFFRLWAISTPSPDDLFSPVPRADPRAIELHGPATSNLCYPVNLLM